MSSNCNASSSAVEDGAVAAAELVPTVAADSSTSVPVVNDASMLIQLELNSALDQRFADMTAVVESCTNFASDFLVLPPPPPQMNNNDDMAIAAGGNNNNNNNNDRSELLLTSPVAAVLPSSRSTVVVNYECSNINANPPPPPPPPPLPQQSLLVTPPPPAIVVTSSNSQPQPLDDEQQHVEAALDESKSDRTVNETEEDDLVADEEEADEEEEEEEEVGEEEEEDEDEEVLDDIPKDAPIVTTEHNADEDDEENEHENSDEEENEENDNEESVDGHSDEEAEEEEEEVEENVVKPARKRRGGTRRRRRGAGAARRKPVVRRGARAAGAGGGRRLEVVTSTSEHSVSSMLEEDHLEAEEEEVTSVDDDEPLSRCASNKPLRASSRASNLDVDVKVEEPSSAAAAAELPPPPPPANGPRRSTRRREPLLLLTPPLSSEVESTSGTGNYHGRLRRSGNNRGGSASSAVASPAGATLLSATPLSTTTTTDGSAVVKSEQLNPGDMTTTTTTPSQPDDAIPLDDDIKTPSIQEKPRKRRGGLAAAQRLQEEQAAASTASVKEESGAEDTTADSGTKRRRGGRRGGGVKRCEACGIEASLTALRFGSGRFCSKTCVGLFANKHRHRSRRGQATDDMMEDDNKMDQATMDGAATESAPSSATRKRGVGNQTYSAMKKTRGGNAADTTDHRSNDSSATASSTPTSSSSSNSFDWQEYLKETNSSSVPKEVFRNPFPTFNASSFFQVDQRLEGIDPRHPSLFCVLSVAQVAGFRLRLHFDGFSSAHDFWTNADSPYLFPCGWTEKSGRKLQMPKGCKRSRFSWPAYLRQKNATAAPSELFTCLRLPPPHPGLRRGQKLEAVDKTNTLLTCVASLADFFGDRMLIHFDGWGDTYDFWTNASSPYLHAVGWCQDMGRALSPPQDYPDIENFTWEDYLAETGSESIPSTVFKGRPPAHFIVGGKIEAVDRRNPSLLRVATVIETADFRVKIRYDGWPENFDIYVDDDCADIHPVGWSSHTGHSIEAPPSVQQNNNNCPGGTGAASACPTYGCRGVGHVKGAMFSNHTSTCGCPYAQPNLDRQNRGGNERLVGSESLAENNTLLQLAERPSQVNGKNGSSSSSSKASAGQRQSDGNKNGDKLGSRRNSSQRHNSGGGNNGGGEGAGRTTEMADSVRRFIFNAPLRTNGSASNLSSSFVMDRLLEAINPDLAAANKLQRANAAAARASKPQPQQQQQQGQNVTTTTTTTTTTTNGTSDSAAVAAAKSIVADGITPRLVASWNVQKVVEFVRSLPGCQQNSQAFADEQIDGAALLLLNQADMLKIMNMKLGPVLKIFSVIQAIKRAT